MAVEKMQMLNVIATLDKLHEVLENIVLAGCVHVENYTYENSVQCLTMQSISNYTDDTDLNHIRKLQFHKYNYKELYEKINFIESILNVKLDSKKYFERDYNFPKAVQRLNDIYEEVLPINDQYSKLIEDVNENEDFSNSVIYIEDSDVKLSEITQLKYFKCHIGTLTKDKCMKLKANYENFPAIALHIGNSENGDSYIILTPYYSADESEKILKSLNFKEIQIPDNFEGTIKEGLEKIRENNEALKKQAADKKQTLLRMAWEYISELNKIYAVIKLEEKIEILKDNVCISDNFLFFSGWVPKSKIDKTVINLDDKNVIVIPKPAEETEELIIPPTKLRNNFLLRPFELLVNMYGIPNYNEIDPTVFLGITYLILFGAMFGDVGQGLVFVAAGLSLCKIGKAMRAYGAILVRIGISSTFFGFMYGSFFGKEDIIQAVLVRPMENINYVLGASVGFGIILLFIGFGLSVFNSLKQKAYDEVLFGRNGLSGLLFYIGLLIAGVQWFLKLSYVPMAIQGIMMVGGLILMLLRVPLYALITNKKAVYVEGKSSYFIEGGFDLIETILSLFSNTVSFIRVGAFALNHVGLFLAFTTMASMANNATISALIFLIGNIIIICLEGLIVLIQGLRLEYYELFSKYFRGDGKGYIPISLSDETEE